MSGSTEQLLHSCKTHMASVATDSPKSLELWWVHVGVLGDLEAVKVS